MRAVKAQRLQHSLVWVNGRARIADVALADQEWARRTDHSKVPNAARGNGYGPDQSDPEAPVVSLAVSTALQKHWLAKQAELDFRVAAKQLVEAGPLLQRIVDVHVRCRTKLLGIPSKAKQAIPHLTTAEVLTIETLVREALEDLATLEPVTDRTVA